MSCPCRYLLRTKPINQDDDYLLFALESEVVRFVEHPVVRGIKHVAQAPKRLRN
jgi:hypothetical protein